MNIINTDQDVRNGKRCERFTANISSNTRNLQTGIKFFFTFYSSRRIIRMKTMKNNNGHTCESAGGKNGLPEDTPNVAAG